LDNPGRRHKENISLTSFRRAGGQRLLSIRGWKHTLPMVICVSHAQHSA
jgi:hypothetical protein